MERKSKISVTWGPPAIADLLEIYDRLAGEYSADFAASSVFTIRAAGAALGSHPRLWRERGDIAAHIRLAPVHRYFICYTIGSHGVKISRIIHEKRDIVALFANHENRA